ALGVPDPPRTEAELAAAIADYRPELAGTAQAREAARFLLLSPPLPLVARAPYGVLAAAAGSLLPRWAPTPPSPPPPPGPRAPAARPAPPAGDRGRGGPPGRAGHGARHPLGHHRAAPGRGQLTAATPSHLTAALGRLIRSPPAALPSSFDQYEVARSRALAHG